MKMLFWFFVLLAGALAGLKFYTDARVRLAEQRSPRLGKEMIVNGLRMHVVRAGRGRPVVFIHGSFGSVYDFALSVLPHVKNYEAILIDRPGHGYSARPELLEMTIFDHARVLHDTIQALGLKQPVLAGHSLGATIALAYALEYPQDLSGLVLAGPYVTPWEGPTNPIHTLAALPLIGEIYLQCLVWPLGQSLQKSIGGKVFYPKLPPADYMAVSSSLAMRPSHFRANASDIRQLNAALRKMQPRWKEVRVPTVILAGDSDLIAPLERHARPLHEAIAHSSLIVLEKTGHQPFFAAPEKIMQAVDSIYA